MKIEKGQEVLVIGIGNNARYNRPIYKGVVTKIGRKWFEVETGNYVGEREKFSLENGKCDGRNYTPEWQVFLSEEDFEKEIKTPELRNELSRRVYRLNYEQLNYILNYIK